MNSITAILESSESATTELPKVGRSAYLDLEGGMRTTRSACPRSIAAVRLSTLLIAVWLSGHSITLAQIAAVSTSGTGNVVSNKPVAFVSVDELKKKAEAGDADAQWQLGNCYYSGTECKQDYGAAVKWLKKAAEQNQPAAEFWLGMCYGEGRGTERNTDEGLKWIRKSADKGYANGQIWIGGILWEKSFKSNIDKKLHPTGDSKQDEDSGKYLDEAMSWFRKAAEQNNPDAQHFLANCYNSRRHGDEDAKAAAFWYRKAAEQGEAESQYRLGRCYANGAGVEKDLNEAAHWYREAAQQGQAQGQVDLGRMYCDGVGVVRNYVEAYKWYSLAAAQGNVFAKAFLEELEGKLSPEQIALAQQLAQAATNFSTATNLPPHLYAEPVVEKGKPLSPGTEPTRSATNDQHESVSSLGMSQAFKSSSVDELRKKAEAGDANAQYSLAACYYNGEGVPQDYTEAVKWYRKAAKQGIADAQLKLGLCYDGGDGTPQDHGEALKWFRKAAEQGEGHAQLVLGNCYDSGQGASKDYDEAVKWFRKAAEQGIAEAQHCLGRCYYMGHGVPQDYSEAVKWFRMAAEQGYAGAQAMVGDCYERGLGVVQDYIEAYKWYNLAAAQKLTAAVSMRDHVARLMTPEQIAGGQRRTSEFVAHKKSMNILMESLKWQFLKDVKDAHGQGENGF